MADPVAAKVWAQQKASLKRLYGYAQSGEKGTAEDHPRCDGAP